MKKTLAIVLAILMLIAFSSCGDAANKTEKTTNPTAANTGAPSSVTSASPATTTVAEITTAEVTTAVVTTGAEDLRASKIAFYSSAILEGKILVPKSGIKIESKNAYANVTQFRDDNYLAVSGNKTKFELLITEKEAYIHATIPSDAIGVMYEEWYQSPMTVEETTAILNEYISLEDTGLFEGITAVDYLGTESANGILAERISTTAAGDLGGYAYSVNTDVLVDPANLSIVSLTQTSVDAETGDTETVTITLTKDIPTFTQPADVTAYITTDAETFAQSIMGLMMLIAFGQ